MWHSIRDYRISRVVNGRGIELFEAWQGQEHLHAVLRLLSQWIALQIQRREQRQRDEVLEILIVRKTVMIHPQIGEGDEGSQILDLRDLVVADVQRFKCSLYLATNMQTRC